MLLASPSNQVTILIIWMKDQDTTSKQLDNNSDEDNMHLTTITIHMYANLKKIQHKNNAPSPFRNIC